MADETSNANGATDGHDLIMHTATMRFMPHTARNRAVLHKLGQRIEERLLDVQAFVQNAPLWQGVPLIFAKDHPMPDAYAKDADAEMARVQGRVIGKVDKPEVVQEGTPRFEAFLEYTDAEAERLHAEGKLGISTCFLSAVKDDTAGTVIYGEQVPHHVLLFELAEKSQPADKATMFLNTAKGGNSMADEETKTLLANLEAQVSEAKTLLANKEAELTAATAEAEQLKAQVQAFKEAEAQRIAAENDKRWQAFKEKYVPPGLVDTEEKVMAYRQKWDTAPHDLMEEMLALHLNKEQPSTAVEGAGEATQGNEIIADILAFKKEVGIHDR